MSARYLISKDHQSIVLLRMAVAWNIPIACNRASADFMVPSPLAEGEYNRLVPDMTTIGHGR
jgi:methylglyoxal synthase